MERLASTRSFPLDFSVIRPQIQGLPSPENRNSVRAAGLSSFERLSCPGSSLLHAKCFHYFHEYTYRRKSFCVANNLKDLHHRIDTVKNTQKVTDAMKLVAAAKVRKAQAAVLNGRPFSENLASVLFNVNLRIRNEDFDIPLTQIRPVRKVALLVMTSDKGLCGGFNNSVLKKAENRISELRDLGVDYTVLSVGKMGNANFKRRPGISIERFIEAGGAPSIGRAQVIADVLFALFMSKEVDKVEIIYTKFVSLIKSKAIIHTLLPLSSEGEVCDVNGVCIDAMDDEMFRLTSKAGNFALEREVVRFAKPDLSPLLLFEQEPVQILEALLPLYLNSQILRSLQESTASELAARMNAMNTASENASELQKELSVSYNRQRQAKITRELMEIVAGANSFIV